MRINGYTITNRTDFVRKFSIYSMWDRIDEVCFFFDKLSDTTEKEEKMTALLKDKNALADGIEFEYADADFYKKDYEKMSQSDKRAITKILALSELGRSDKKEDVSKFLSGTAAKDDSEPHTENGEISVNTIVDVTGHVGLEFERYEQKIDGAPSKSNPIYIVTYINRSEDGFVNIKVLGGAEKRVDSLRLFSKEAVGGVFINGKLVGFLPVIGRGMRHFVTFSAEGKYTYNLLGRKLCRPYGGIPEDCFYFDATNDGIVLLSGSEGIVYYSDVQQSFDLPLSEGEKPVMICARDHDWVVLTNFGRLFESGCDDEVGRNVIYVVMRESGIWYALAADNTIIADSDAKRGFCALTDTEVITFPINQTDRYEIPVQCEIASKKPHFAIFDNFTVLKAGNDVFVAEHKSDEVRCYEI